MIHTHIQHAKKKKSVPRAKILKLVLQSDGLCNCDTI